MNTDNGGIPNFPLLHLIDGTKSHGSYAVIARPQTPTSCAS
jgi:hypothetical protein